MFDRKRIFYIDKRTCTNRTRVFKLKEVTVFGMKFRFYAGEMLIFYWKEAFQRYFEKNNMKEKVRLLKKGMDKTSCDYVDHFMRLTKLWKKGFTKSELWLPVDYQIERNLKKFCKTFKQPYPQITQFDESSFLNTYGLDDLPEEAVKAINGRGIIDGGGYNGDTAIVFHQKFPESQIYVFEPLGQNIKTIKAIVQEAHAENKIIPIQKGLGDKKEKVEIHFNHVEMADITTVDDEFEGKEIGLIKLDTEGFETKIINGSMNIIKKNKPVLAIAIYHTPEDFFDLKAKIDSFGLGYKFMIRRSELTLPQADLVLYAY